MIKWEQLGAGEMPGGGGELRLMRRGAELSIMAGSAELMNNRLTGSEEALATLTCAKLRDPERARVLIGGLGMGFTLRAALTVLPPGARVTVAELVPAVAEWARGSMAELFAGSLDDPRVTLEVQDVAAVIAKGGWDAILLDVDNGPRGLTRGGNDRLYDLGGLAAAQQALTPGGVLAVWSSAPAPEFTERLKAAGYAVAEMGVRARAGRKGARHVIWLATAPD